MIKAIEKIFIKDKYRQKLLIDPLITNKAIYRDSLNCLFNIRSRLNMSMNSPIKKPLVLINQSNSGYLLIYFYHKFLDRAKEANTYNGKSRRLSSQILSFSYFFNFIFKENIFNEENNRTLKLVVVEEKLDYIVINNNGN